jgi:hypothetical protein
MKALLARECQEIRNRVGSIHNYWGMLGHGEPARKGGERITLNFEARKLTSPISVLHF